MIFNDAQCIDLIHHVFFHRERVDDLVLDARLGHHVVYVEMECEITTFIQITHDACSVDDEFLVVCVHVYTSESHPFIRPANAYPQVQGDGELSQHWCKGL